MNPSRRNKLLHRLLRFDHSLGPRLSEEVYPTGHELLQPGTSASHALFPTGGVIALMVRTKQGQQIEVNAVGAEGMFGLHGVLGLKRTPFLVVQQVDGPIARLPVSVLRASIAARADVRDLVDRYRAFQLTTAHLFVACNVVHGARARAARWILMTADRAMTDEYPLTQEMLAQMVGVSRQFLSEVAHAFKDAGLIDYRRGQMSILRRPALEREACDCYGVLNKEYADTVGA